MVGQSLTQIRKNIVLKLKLRNYLLKPKRLPKLCVFNNASLILNINKSITAIKAHCKNLKA